MKRVAFKMQLHKGFEEEYRQRHDAIWPELVSLLKESGISDYSIFLDEESGALFGTMLISDTQKVEQLPGHPVMQKWWLYMKDIMQCNPDNSPVSISLNKVFYLS